MHGTPTLRTLRKGPSRERTLVPVMEEDAAAAALDGVDDAFLVARSVDGDLRAFTTLLQRHNRTLRRYVERLTRNPSDTDDVLQDTAVIAWQHLQDIREPAKVRSWLIQTATREALRHVTGRPAEVELAEDHATIPGPDSTTDRLDLRQALQDTLDALPEQQARCWILRELGGYRYSEIAAQLDIPESTVRGALAAARKTILQAMGEWR